MRRFRAMLVVDVEAVDECEIPDKALAVHAFSQALDRFGEDSVRVDKIFENQVGRGYADWVQPCGIIQIVNPEPVPVDIYDYHDDEDQLRKDSKREEEERRATALSSVNLELANLIAKKAKEILEIEKKGSDIFGLGRVEHIAGDDDLDPALFPGLRKKEPVIDEHFRKY